MMFLNWTRVAILYEDEYGLIRLQELVRAPPSKNVEIYIRQTGPDNYRFWVLLKLVNYCPLNINCNLNVPDIEIIDDSLITERCWGRSRGRRSTTSSWTLKERTPSSSSGTCCSSRWTMTGWARGQNVSWNTVWLITSQYHYTFTSFDVETLDLEDFKYNQVNITAFRYWEDSCHHPVTHE